MLNSTISSIIKKEVNKCMEKVQCEKQKAWKVYLNYENKEKFPLFFFKSLSGKFSKKFLQFLIAKNFLKPVNQLCMAAMYTYVVIYGQWSLYYST